jgi:4-amino-4-deoxy-L-arabinose transferase-like glycosyltransferase
LRVFRVREGKSLLARWWGVCVLGLLAAHGGLLAWSATRHSPSHDEVGHLAAGVSHWELGRFELYCVNPPLVRMLAAVPVVLSRPNTDWRIPVGMARPEWQVGRQFIAANPEHWLWYYMLARWACIPLSALGGYVCYRWARDLSGRAVGLLALLLWCTCPNVLAHAAMLTPDAGAAALGVTAAYAYWRWLRRPGWGRTLVAGFALGLAELAKTTWLVLFPLWPLLWLAWQGRRREEASAVSRFGQAGQLTVMLVVAVYLLNLGYGFDGSFGRLGDYRFKSQALTGPADSGGGSDGNRFAGGWLADLPVPLPQDYLRGIDLQRFDLERKASSYLHGEWRVGGWWYYYLYAAAIKVPLGTWLLVFLAAWLQVRGERGRLSLKDALALFAPPVAVVVLVSSQTGFNHHFRYVLSALPFLFIFAGGTARVFAGEGWKLPALVVVAAAWSVASSLGVYPHTLAYFNEAAGGPLGGHAHLIHSNIEWGQDLLYLKRWQDGHPEARPLRLAYDSELDPSVVGVAYVPPSGEPTPGWHAVSVNELRHPTGRCAYFLGLRPVAMAGYSIYIYHVTLEEANRARRARGLPELAGPSPPVVW